MSAPGVSHIQLMNVELRNIKLFLAGRRINIDGYHEKAELAQLIVDYNRSLYPWTAPRDPYTSNSNFPSSYTSSNLRNAFSHSAMNISPNGREQHDNTTGAADLYDHTSSNSSVASQSNQASQSVNNL